MRVAVDPSLLTRLTAELQRRSIDMLLVETKDEARDAVLGLIPRGATIMAGSSLTLDAIGLTDRLKGGEYRYLQEGRPDARRRARPGAHGRRGSGSAPRRTHAAVHPRRCLSQPRLLSSPAPVRENPHHRERECARPPYGRARERGARLLTRAPGRRWRRP